MTDVTQENLPSRQELALERTRMASVRTEFSLMRTGFTIASFGGGVTQLLGRNIWPLWMTNVLTVAFVLTGIFCVMAGALRFQHQARRLGHDLGMSPFVLKVMLIIPGVLMGSLLGLLLLILFV